MKARLVYCMLNIAGTCMHRCMSCHCEHYSWCEDLYTHMVWIIKIQGGEGREGEGRGGEGGGGEGGRCVCRALKRSVKRP